jgi:hypothetical protein
MFQKLRLRIFIVMLPMAFSLPVVVSFGGLVWHTRSLRKPHYKGPALLETVIRVATKYLT